MSNLVAVGQTIWTLAGVPKNFGDAGPLGPLQMRLLNLKVSIDISHIPTLPNIPAS